VNCISQFLLTLSARKKTVAHVHHASDLPAAPLHLQSPQIPAQNRRNSNKASNSTDRRESLRGGDHAKGLSYADDDTSANTDKCNDIPQDTHRGVADVKSKPECNR
jgi:hypothetical protein